MILNSSGKRPRIDYPCHWDYKIIGTDVEEMIKAIEDAVNDLEYEITPSNISKNEKYYSINLKVLVPSEVVRNLIFQNIDKNEFVKMVL